MTEFISNKTLNLIQHNDDAFRMVSKIEKAMFQSCSMPLFQSRANGQIEKYSMHSRVYSAEYTLNAEGPQVVMNETNCVDDALR
jgi:hypothetical protein